MYVLGMHQHMNSTWNICELIDNLLQKHFCTCWKARLAISPSMRSHRHGNSESHTIQHGCCCITRQAMTLVNFMLNPRTFHGRLRAAEIVQQPTHYPLWLHSISNWRVRDDTTRISPSFDHTNAVHEVNEPFLSSNKCKKGATPVKVSSRGILALRYAQKGLSMGQRVTVYSTPKGLHTARNSAFQICNCPATYHNQIALELYACWNGTRRAVSAVRRGAALGEEESAGAGTRQPWRDHDRNTANELKEAEEESAHGDNTPPTDCWRHEVKEARNYRGGCTQTKVAEQQHHLIKAELIKECFKDGKSVYAEW